MGSTTIPNNSTQFHHYSRLNDLKGRHCNTSTLFHKIRKSVEKTKFWTSMIHYTSHTMIWHIVELIRGMFTLRE